MPETATDVSVLIVDDEEDLVDLYAWRLDDYETHTATTGQTALDIIADDDTAVDVVLLDRSLPDLTGDDVASAMRDAGFTGPIAMVTGAEQDFSLTNSAFNAHLQKPLDDEDLRSAIERLHP